jgi:hypothetical protein
MTIRTTGRRGRATPRAALIAATLMAVTWNAPALAQQCGDLDGSGSVVATDALLLLRKAVNQPVSLVCEMFPNTGVETSFHADINGMAGADVPDDGAVRAGAALAFTDNGDGTILDRNTGLMWEKKGDDGGLHDKDLALLWSSTSEETVWDWLDDVNAEGGNGFAGYDDWRLPNIKELASLVDFENPAPVIPHEFHDGCVGGCSVTTCSCTASEAYWSSTTYRLDTADAWSVSFLNQNLDFAVKGLEPLRVRAVRDAYR